MTPQELKNSILQLAIQGKLVEQRPEEGTAEELYQQIKAETIKTDKKVIQITDDELPFEIPESWKWVRLKNIAILYNGRAYKQTELLEQGKYPVLRVGNLFTSNKWYYSDLELEYDKYCDNGDLLYSWSASFGPFIWNGDKVIYHYHIWKIEFSSFIDKRYLYYMLFADTERIKKDGHGVAMIHVTKSGTEERLFPLPPLAEQKRIVAKIEELLPLIDRYEEAWTKLGEFNKRFPGDMQKSLLQMAIQGKLVEQRPEEGTGEELYAQIQAEKQALIKSGKIKKDKPLPEITDDEKPFDIPDSWIWVRLQELCSLIGDIDHNMPKAVASGKGVPFLSAKDLLDDGTINFKDDIKYISEEDFLRLSRKALPQKNDIIYSRIGAALGKARVVESETKFLVSYSCCTIRLLFVDSFYLRYYLESPLILAHSFEARQSTGVPDLGMGEIKKFMIALPPLAEQKRIVAKLEELLPLCERLK